VVCVLVLLRAAPAPADSFFVAIVLNGEDKGVYPVTRADDGDFLVRTEDLKSMGLAVQAGEATAIDGEPHASLGSLGGLTFAFREKTLSLEITAAPSLLPRRTIDFRQQRRARVHYPKDSGGFLNYGVGYTAGDDFEFQGFDVAGQLGVRLGDVLFLSDSSYQKSSTEEKWLRLMTNVTYDRRSELQRLVFGDFFASSGDLGGTVNLGGVSFSKVYRIDPYFLRYPTANFSGMVSLPSQADVYLDGMRIRTEKLAPGTFELRNLASYGGKGTVSVVIKDPFGREQRLRYPFYFTDILLKKGLHEYSYDLGLQRRDFGAESNRYADLTFSAFHNYGMSDSLTIGVRAEGVWERANLGPQASFLIPNAGIATLSLSGSRKKEGGEGAAGSFSHGYQSPSINTRLLLRGFTRNYASAGEETAPNKVRYEVAAGVGYRTRRLGALSLDFERAKLREGPDRQTVASTYSRNLTYNSTLILSARRIQEQESSYELFAALTYSPWRDISLSARYAREGDSNREAVQMQKNPPVGEGWGYRASLERTDDSPVASTTFNPFAQYNGRYGICSAEYRGETFDGGGGNEFWRVSASGAIAYAGRTFAFSRPITDSFGVVKVGELEGVRVYVNNQEVGKTNAAGKAVLPSLVSYYENQISINDKDIPIDYSLSEVARFVSPPLRSGSVIFFDATKFQAITGTLRLRFEGVVKPIEHHEVEMEVDGKKVSFSTGKGGEFYLENIGPGTYEASFGYEGKTCAFEMRIPRSEEMIVELGGLLCEDVR
jgi:outer membrane usher protein FimD/PapC